MAKMRIKEARLNYNLKDKLIEKLNNGLYDVIVPYLATLSDTEIRNNDMVLEDEISIPTFNQGFSKKVLSLDRGNSKRFDRMTKTHNAYNKEYFALMKNAQLANEGVVNRPRDKSSVFRPVEVALPIMGLVELNENDFTIKIKNKSSAFEIMERVQNTIDEIRSSIFVKDYDLKDRLEKFLNDVLKINKEDLVEKVNRENLSDIDDIFGTGLFTENKSTTKNKYDLSKIKM